MKQKELNKKILYFACYLFILILFKKGTAKATMKTKY
ncbi:hypothetical protein DSH65_11910 [Enterococcus faecalis]|uniref:Uncharacterized protein n=2 Tax=Enterococcus faecalis TaxID=1351 RepID=Q838K5_ENTFA|nr:hypothetical protein EF_0441 [Enterococcus faecalis V583]ARV02758.1 hypothetical protein A6B47_02395 [Enterococcus faecalis]AZV33147.1 hypothetical protein CVT43_01830 [Enterococcus faecalis OG1RF]EEI58031.1 hypothetical protein HMPREF0346_0971 [Enterococcus faecalis EnGen0297]EEN73151.1 hypothetical protein HMPREF0349_2891 [Enterococcus faecalis TX1322]MRI75634.1 hypothetical protein [Enterococcus mundtii]QGI54811.1 hypothetical protein EYB36_02805 [Enterococcus faecalis R712]